ncbi:MAG: hypothetical protein R3B36_23555 [Polyangiaceae bacterium]|nr:hypothetical protein [Myxococcales bacterium]
MRTNPKVILGALLLSHIACTPSARVTVVRSASGEDGREVSGDPVKVKRGVIPAYSGPRSGYFVLRSDEDWESGWDTSKDGARPRSLEDRSQMALFAVAEGVDTTELKLGRVVENATHIHAFVSETLIGQGCVERPEKPPFDAIVMRRSEKPIQFHVVTARARSCGEAPEADLKCRVEKAPEWSASVVARPGDAIECEATSRVRGTFAVVDRVLTMMSAPPGSTTKMALTKNGTRGAFVVDAYGPYKLRFEAVDDSGRRGTATAQVDATPPKTDDVYVQLAWGNFDRQDDPATFPRVTLAITEVRDPKAPPSRLPPEECSAETKNHMPDCDLRAIVGYAFAKLKTRDKKVQLRVRYQDERIEKGPMVCLRAWYKGELTLDACDRLARAADDTWTTGPLDLSTGKPFDPDAPPPAAAEGDAGAAPSADGGAPATK